MNGYGFDICSISSDPASLLFTDRKVGFYWYYCYTVFINIWWWLCVRDFITCTVDSLFHFDYRCYFSPLLSEWNHRFRPFFFSQPFSFFLSSVSQYMKLADQMPCEPKYVLKLLFQKSIKIVLLHDLHNRGCWTSRYPLIDANMKELSTTGFMSNRGRQVSLKNG